MIRGTLASLACFGIALVGEVPARGANTNAQEVEEDHSLASRLVTPHKAWGRGFAGGPIRALFLVHAGHSSGEWNDPGTRLREVVELAQRFDLKAEAILFAGSGNTWEFHGQQLGEARAARLLARPYELYVIAGFPLEKLPARMQFMIIEQVAKGAGLVCCGAGAAEFMTSKRQIRPLPAMLSDAMPRLEGKNLADSVAAYRMGKGRGVWLNCGAQSLTPYHEFTFRRLAEYDYWMLLVGRAALWAASRETELSLTATGTPRVPSAKTQGLPLRSADEIVFVLKSPRSLTVQVELELRRACDGLKKGLAAVDATLAPGQAVRVPVAVPRLRAGDYLVDAVVRSGRGVEAFGAASMVVESEFGVDKIELSQSFVERGDPIAVRTLLRGPPPAGAVLQVRLRDSYDRVLRQHEIGRAHG